jgi:hypothetical protein
MTTKTMLVIFRVAAMLIGVGLFLLGLLKEDIQVFWLGTVLFIVGFAVLVRATKAENLAREVDSGGG